MDPLHADGRSIQRSLEEETLSPEDALGPLTRAAHAPPTLALRIDACRVLGALSGRAYQASWDVAERAAFSLPAIACEADAPTERVGLLHAMGRGFRNLWLMPYVHARLSDDDESVVAAALSAAGDLAFPALEEAIASGFLSEETSDTLRLAAIAALGRMGAESAASRLVPFVSRGPTEAATALSALTEIRSRVGESAALDVLGREPPREVLVAAMRYLAEMGRPEGLGTLRRLARDEDADLRIAAGLASRAFKAERASNADERILAALTEPDRAVRAALARRLRTLPIAGVLEQAELLLRDDAEGIVEIVAERLPEVTRLLLKLAVDLDAASLVPELVSLARDEPERADLRVAAFVALGEIGSPARFADLVFLWNREDDPDALGAASRALERAFAAPSQAHDAPAPSSPTSAPPSLARVHDRLKKLLASTDATVRAAAARVAGLTPGSVPIELLAALVDDSAPRVREQAVTALGRLARPECATVLVHALADADPAIQERASAALLALGAAASTARVIDFVSRTIDRAAALRVASRLALPTADTEAFVEVEALGAALLRVAHDDPVYEVLLTLKVDALEATRPAPTSASSVDASIAAAFPTWTRLAVVRGFEPLGKSLRTAEMLFVSTERGTDTDLSAAIVLWMKCLEGYLHAWLAPRLRALQQEPRTLWELTDRVLGTGWPAYQRYLSERWTDPVMVGALSVDVPLRSVVNALRELQERRLKSLDSPASVTEWSRMMLFFAVDHATGAKNVLKVIARDSDKTVRLAHRLQVLAQVRNAVTHRSVAGAATLTEFRRAYYSAFEEFTAMA